MHLIKLKATPKDGGESENVGFEVSDEDVSKLKQYVSNCKRLSLSKIFKNGFPSVQNISWNIEDGLTFKIGDFDYGDVCELLHLARPLMLSKEPASFEKCQAVIGMRTKGTAISLYLKYLRDVYERGDYQPYFQISVGDVPLFHDETLKTWLNGVEYHQDTEKAEVIAGLQHALTSEVARGIFISQLSGRIRAVFMLNHLAELVVTKIES